MQILDSHLYVQEYLFLKRTVILLQWHLFLKYAWYHLRENGYDRLKKETNKDREDLEKTKF